VELLIFANYKAISWIKQAALTGKGLFEPSWWMLRRNGGRKLQSGPE
jgi:hypothetical protein